jgi:uncharacterized membrane protein (DUF4010 family)
MGESPLVRLGIAVALGLLVGLQRQHERNRLAGIRTFPLLAAVGGLCGLMSPPGEPPWILAGGFLAVAAVLVAGLYRLPAVDGEGDGGRPGLTTLVAALLMFCLGGWLGRGGDLVVGVVAGAGAAALLHAKGSLHGLVARLGQGDVQAVFRFALIALVVLPVLPNHDYTVTIGGRTYEIINPFSVWMLVVLIVGVSLLGYVALRLVGPRAGAALGAVLGGVVSSTATTASFSRAARVDPAMAPVASAAVQLATTASMLRLSVLVAVAMLAVPGASPWAVVQPLLALAAIMGAITLVAFLGGARHPHVPEPGNPAELWPALLFAGLYAVIRAATDAGHQLLGDSGLYAVAALSGTTDLDAIALSSSGLAAKGQITADLAWRAVVVGTIANLVFKTGIAWSLGGRPMGVRTALWYGLSALGGVGLLLFWR